MSARTQQLLDAAARAVHNQNWREAWLLLEQVDQYEMGSQDGDLGILAATCLRHQGNLDHAEHLYQQVQKGLGLQDPRLADVVIGLADCAHLRGDFLRAEQLARAAVQLPLTDRTLALRIATLAAHIHTHLQVDEALAQFQALAQQGPLGRDTAWANFAFQYGDALLIGGYYPESLEQLQLAYQLANEVGATITLADSMRRLPLVRILLGHDDYALRGVNDLQLAAQLYDLADDRGGAYLHTEAGEVYRALGRYREAEREFTRGLWAARQVGDGNRVAHNQLGLFEISRASGQLRHTELQAAQDTYRSIGSEWGLLHCQIAGALASQRHMRKGLKRAQAMVEAASSSRFHRERALLERLSGASDRAARREPHLMNYP